MPLTLATAQIIVRDALAEARSRASKPLCVVVLDARSAVTATASEDGTSLRRFEIARGKASGALAFNVGSRKLGDMAVERPHFVAAVTHLIEGGLVPVAGGVLIRDKDGVVLGAVGISGDNSDNDESAAAAGIAAAGFVPDGG